MFDPSNIPPELLQALMQQQSNGQGAMAQEVGIYKNLGPEGLRGVTDMGSLDQRSALAAQQSQQQQDMVGRQLEGWQKNHMTPQGPHASVASAIFDGVGGLAKTVGGGIAGRRQEDAMNEGFAKQGGILGQQDQGRFNYANARSQSFQDIVNALAKRQQVGVAGMGQSAGGPGFGLDYGGLDPSLFGG